MSNTTSGPSLDDYPGYFPASKPPFWTRTKVGAGAVLLGLFLGVAASPGTADPVKPARAGAAIQTTPDPNVDQEIQAAVDEATQSLSDRVDRQSAKLADEKAQMQDQKHAAAAALKRFKRQAAVAQRHAVMAAVNKTRAQAQAAAPAPAQPQPLASTGGGTDPQFDYCYEANDAGYGPYYRGQDPEYAWYDDADGDGVVCET